MYQIGIVSYKKIRDFILDNGIESQHIIVLNYLDFDELILEYRRLYDEPFTVPFEIITVQIVEDRSKRVPRGYIQLK